MRKILVLVLVYLFFANPLFTQTTGEVSITKKLSLIKTEYFDFIFPKESEPTAQHLAQYADDMYRKATGFLNVESTMRFPVVITPETDRLNAYFNPFPVFRIVMYDTVPSESLAVFSDTLVSVFYHEVIHAISMNIKSQFWNDLSVVFGDIPSLFMVLNIPTSFIEGTAVLAESLDGEGRLNSAYAVHVIKQAKIEDKFPDWRDITGAYQLFTNGSLPYIFGGAFSNYLYQKYGMEKFADFWNQNSKFNFTFYEGAFKKVYALSLDEAWQDFEDSIYIPPLAPPAQALFLQETLLRTTGQLYHNLASSPDGIAWQDGFTGTVYFLPHEAESQKLKILYTTDLTNRLHFSRNGKYLVSSGFTGGSKVKNTVRVYDMERQKNILTQKGLRDGAILTIPKNITDSPLNGVSTVLAGIQTDAALASLVLYDMEALQLSADSEPLVTIPFERNVFLFEPVDAGNGLLVALMHNLGTWQFFVYDYITGTERIYEVDEQFLSPSGIQNLYVSDTRLYMSYAQDVFSQPVLAYVNLEDFRGETLALHMQTEQASGGVFDPIVISDTEQGENVQIAYLSLYYENRALSLLAIEGEDLFENLTFNTSLTQDTTSVAITDYHIEPYRPSEYMNKGVLIPFAGSINLNPFTDFLPKNLSVGATAITIDPTGRFLIIGGAGYDWTDKNFTAALSTVFTENYFTAATDVFTASSLVQLETFATKLSTGFVIPLGSNFNSLQFSNTLSWFYLAEENEYLLEGHTLYDMAEISFSHLKPTGQFFYDRLGLTYGAQLAVQKQFSQNKSMPDIVGALFLGLQTPQLLPFKNPDRFALNLPGRVVVYRYFNSEHTWKIQSNFVVFAYDIQKPISFIPLFVQRLTLDAGLDCMWYTSSDLEITLHGSLFTTFTLNTGYATALPIDLGLAFTWDPHIAGTEGFTINLKFDINLRL